MPHILLATDIFGYTKAIETLKHRFESLGEVIHILDPYDAKQMNFHDEEQAYKSFNQLCGLESYAKACMQALDACSNEEMVIIGFSIGASAFWKALEGYENAKIKHFFGFYSSQIRHCLDAKVLVPCTLIFPQYEKHFDVDEVITKLIKHANITCLKTAYLHGFMNPLSVNYHANGYAEYCQRVENTL